MTKLALTPGRLIQVAYVVESLEESVQHFARDMNLGGWVVMENMKFNEILYRGTPASVNISAALAYSGETMVELIQQHDLAPSVFREVIESTGYGFHHLALTVASLDEAIDGYKRRGYEVAMNVGVGSKRAAYIDTRNTLRGMLELVECGDDTRDFFAVAYDRAQELEPQGLSIHNMQLS